MTAKARDAMVASSCSPRSTGERMSRRYLLPLIALAVVGAAPVHAAHYRLTRAVPLGAPERWDYLVYDPPSHRVYVAHGDHLTVVDGRNGRVIGQVEGMPGGTHGIAISHAAGLGYTDDGRAGEGVAFSL